MVLLNKEGRDPATPEAYRPLCIIDGVAKAFEYILKHSIMDMVGSASFAKNQFGFAKGRNTTQALERVKNFTKAK